MMVKLYLAAFIVTGLILGLTKGNQNEETKADMEAIKWEMKLIQAKMEGALRYSEKVYIDTDTYNTVHFVPLV